MRRRLNSLPPGRRFGAPSSHLSRPCRLASQLALGRKHDHSAGFCFWEENVLFLFSCLRWRRTRDRIRSGEVARRAGSGRSTAMPPSVQNARIRVEASCTAGIDVKLPSQIASANVSSGQVSARCLKAQKWIGAELHSQSVPRNREDVTQPSFPVIASPAA